MNREPWDVIVCGAGPAGAAVALLLARAGRRTALVDAAHFPRQKVCGEFLSAAGCRALIDLGLGALVAETPRLQTFQLAVPGGRVLEWRPDRPEQRDAAALSRWVLDAALVEAAVAAGATPFFGRRVRDVRIAGGRAEGIAAVAVDDADDVVELRAPLIVAADGRRSQVVRATGRTVGRPRGRIGFKQHVVVDDPTPYAGRLSLHSLPGGYVGVCPVDERTINLCGTMPKELLHPVHGAIGLALRRWTPPTAPLRRLLEAPPSATPAADGVRWSTMPDVARQCSTPQVDGVLYVGDAQGTIEPLTGQGMAMALSAAPLLVRHVLAADRRPIDRPRQQAYAAEWHAWFDPPIRAADWFGRWLRRPHLVTAAMVGAGLWPPLARAIITTIHRRTCVAVPSVEERDSGRRRVTRAER